jgi:hypothetical protein
VSALRRCHHLAGDFPSVAPVNVGVRVSAGARRAHRAKRLPVAEVETQSLSSYDEPFGVAHDIEAAS